MPQLNDEQTREINRADKLLQFLNIPTNIAIWDPYKPFKDEVVLLTDYVEKINSLVPRKEQSGKQITLNKDQLKSSFAKTVGGIFSITSVYARKFADDSLLGKVKNSETYIYEMKDTEIIGFANGIRTDIFTDALLTNTDFMPYGITLVQITAAIDIAQKFNQKIGLSASIQVSSDTANVDITAFITNMRTSVANMLDLKSNFDATFITGLEKAAVRDEIGVKHTGIIATITVGGVAVKGGKLTIGKKTYNSNQQGNVKPRYVRAGNKNIIVELHGYPTKNITHLFIKGQMDKMNFDF